MVSSNELGFYKATEEQQRKHNPFVRGKRKRISPPPPHRVCFCLACLSDNGMRSSGNSLLIGAIAGGCASFVLLLLLIIVIAVVWRRRKQNLSGKTELEMNVQPHLAELRTRTPTLSMNLESSWARVKQLVMTFSRTVNIFKGFVQKPNMFCLFQFSFGLRETDSRQDRVHWWQDILRFPDLATN